MGLRPPLSPPVPPCDLHLCKGEYVAQHFESAVNLLIPCVVWASMKFMSQDDLYKTPKPLNLGRVD